MKDKKETFKLVYNFRECDCCDNCKHRERKGDSMTSTVCSELFIDTTDEGDSRVCDLYERED